MAGLNRRVGYATGCNRLLHATTSDTEKKQKQGEFITPPRPTGMGVKNASDIKSVGQLYIAQPRSPDGHDKLKEHFDINHTKSQIHAA